MAKSGSFKERFFSIAVTETASHIGRAVYFIGLSTAYWLGLTARRRQKRIAAMQLQRFQSERKQLQLSNDLSKAQLQYIKAQISPHFIFNALNAVYCSVEETDSASAEIISLLSQIMRYALADLDADGKVALSEEIANIGNIIKLAQLRYGDKCFIHFTCLGEVSNQRIIPVILSNLVENILSHGDLSDPLIPAVIKVILKNNSLYFYTKNKKNYIDLSVNKAWNSTGIEFAKQRLESYYPEKFTLDITNDSKIFETTLKIEYL
ncbi:hypothetical protein A9P82_13005 [Arachidicoccus ginsenosidimutans]|nr:hypothetical protein A9P82_13005 [Arachidicoccus sp. BS20]